MKDDWSLINARYMFADYPSLQNQRIIPMSVARYHIIHGNTHAIVESFNTESAAIERAERLAQQTPEIDFVVMMSITKSRATKPVITTRF